MAQELDLLLVNPNNRSKMYGTLGLSLSAIEPPFWIGLIAAFIRKKGFSVKIIDADAKDWDEDLAATVGDVIREYQKQYDLK